MQILKHFCKIWTKQTTWDKNFKLSRYDIQYVFQFLTIFHVQFSSFSWSSRAKPETALTIFSENSFTHKFCNTHNYLFKFFFFGNSLPKPQVHFLKFTLSSKISRKQFYMTRLWSLELSHQICLVLQLSRLCNFYKTAIYSGIKCLYRLDICTNRKYTQIQSTLVQESSKNMLYSQRYGQNKLTKSFKWETENINRFINYVFSLGCMHAQSSNPSLNPRPHWHKETIIQQGVA